MPKYTIEIGAEADRQLGRVSSEKGTSKAEIMRRALATYVYLSDETVQGNKVAIKDKNRQNERELVLP